jgi:hypothetical protein
MRLSGPLQARVSGLAFRRGLSSSVRRSLKAIAGSLLAKPALNSSVCAMGLRLARRGGTNAPTGPQTATTPGYYGFTINRLSEMMRPTV